MAVINIDDAYFLNETGAQVDKVTGLFTKDEAADETEKAQARENIGVGASTQIFNTITDVSSDNTVTLSEDAGNFSWLVIQFNTASSNPSATRYTIAVPVAISGSIAWYPLPNGGGVRLSATGTNLRIVESSFPSLYLIRAYGIY